MWCRIDVRGFAVGECTDPEYLSQDEFKSLVSFLENAESEALCDTWHVMDLPEDADECDWTINVMKEWNLNIADSYENFLEYPPDRENVTNWYEEIYLKKEEISND